MAVLDYPFTEQESKAAHDEWGANCGPNALAFALQIPIADVRGIIPDFESKRYTSPSMMKAALAKLGIGWFNCVASKGGMFWAEVSLVRIQWCGPWTEPGANPKWAYRQTHWIATWSDDEGEKVFDCNGGIMSFRDWESKIVPILVGMYPRANGDWRPTHVWRIARET